MAYLESAPKKETLCTTKSFNYSGIIKPMWNQCYT